MPPTHQAELVKAFRADVDEVAALFAAGRAAPTLGPNAPPHAGAVGWVRGLKARLAEPYAKLSAKEHASPLEGRDGEAAEAAYNKAMVAMDAFERGVVEAWCQQVRVGEHGGLGQEGARRGLWARARAEVTGARSHLLHLTLAPSHTPQPSKVDCTSEEKLNLPLLQFHEDATPELPLLAVNFDPALVALLRETKYFLLAGVPVPDAAAVVFQRGQMYRTQIGALDLMVRGRVRGEKRRSVWPRWCLQGPRAPAGVPAGGSAPNPSAHRFPAPLLWPPLAAGVAVQPHPA
jgi:dynein heavy chain